MPILKAPQLQPKNETVQLRLSESVKFRLARYAEFIHASTSYVVTETLERLFRKDTEFQAYLDAYKPPASHPIKKSDQTPPLGVDACNSKS